MEKDTLHNEDEEVIETDIPVDDDYEEDEEIMEPYIQSTAPEQGLNGFQTVIVSFIIPLIISTIVCTIITGFFNYNRYKSEIERYHMDEIMEEFEDINDRLDELEDDNEGINEKMSQIMGGLIRMNAKIDQISENE